MSEPRKKPVPKDIVVLPVSNEARTIGRVLDDVRKVFDGDVLVVDDGSTDGSGSIAAEASGVRVVAHDRRLGYGASVIDGFRHAIARGYERIVTMDGDGQHDPHEVPSLFAGLDRADVASGSRYRDASRVIGEAPSERRSINARVTSMINTATGFALTDAFCGFKAYRVTRLDRLRLVETGWGFPVELWAELHRQRLSVVEVPVARIYLDATRTFGGGLDDAEARYAFYARVWQTSFAREAER